MKIRRLKIYNICLPGEYGWSRSLQINTVPRRKLFSAVCIQIYAPK